jgi:hypothetical protein
MTTTWRAMLVVWEEVEVECVGRWGADSRTLKKMGMAIENEARVMMQ